MALRRGLRHIEALVAQLTLPLYADEGHVVDDERLLDFLQLQDTFEWNGMLSWKKMGLISSLSKTVNFFGSLDCKRDKRADNPVTTFNTRFNARSAVDSSSKPTAVCAGSPYDCISGFKAAANVDSARSLGTGYWGTGAGGNSSNHRMRPGRSMGQHKSTVLTTSRLLKLDIRSFVRT